MTQSFSSPGPATEVEDESPGTTDVAQDQASQLGQGAADASQHVASVAKDQAATVATEAGRQAKDLLAQTQTELSQQAAAQQKRVAEALHGLADELHAMTEHDGDSGVATDLARQAAGKSHDLAHWLDDREPGQLVNEVRSFARRRPAAFLGLAVGAGLLAGRLTRGITATPDEDDNPSAITTPNSAAGRPVPASPPGTAGPVEALSADAEEFPLLYAAEREGVGYSTPPETAETPR